MMIDNSTDFGKRVERRLQEDGIAWLTTVDSTGTPQPRPIWFLWDGESFLIYSEQKAAKVAHIAHNPHVSLNLDGDEYGNDIIVMIGEASIDSNAPAADQLPAYIEKYREGLKSIPLTPAEFAVGFSAAIRVRPTKLRGH